MSEPTDNEKLLPAAAAGRRGPPPPAPAPVVVVPRWLQLVAAILGGLGALRGRPGGGARAAPVPHRRDHRADPQPARLDGAARAGAPRAGDPRRLRRVLRDAGLRRHAARQPDRRPVLDVPRRRAVDRALGERAARRRAATTSTARTSTSRSRSRARPRCRRCSSASSAAPTRSSPSAPTS